MGYWFAAAPTPRAACFILAFRPPFEQQAHALACAWLSPRMDDEQEARVQALVDAACIEDRDRMQGLSEGWRTWRLSYLAQYSTEPGLQARLERAAAQALASGFPRAQLLAKAGLAGWAELSLPGGTAHLRSRADELKELVDAMPAAWPPVERCLCEIRLGELELQLARSEQVLERFMRLERLDYPPPLDEPMRANVRQLLVVLLLEMGDLEGGLASSQGLLRHVERGQARSVSLYFNHLLALGLSEQYDEARAFLAERPFLRQASYWKEVPHALGLLAWLDSRCGGGGDGAGPGWPALEGHLPSAGGNPMAANLAWMQAELLLRQGDARRAVDVLQTYLHQVKVTGGGSLSPLNGTMAYQTLSRAQEAVGDTAAALDALRRAHSHGHEWTLRSTEARLKALHLAAPEADAGVQSRRVRALQDVQDPGPADAATRLLAHVSHELRNPLQGVLGMITLLQMSGLDEGQRRQLQLADTSARMALALCNDLLDLARLDSGRLEVHAVPCDLRALLTEATQTWRPLAEGKGLALRCHTDPALPPVVQVDRLRLQQVLMNLLANAVKFTRHGHVQLSAHWLPGSQDGRLRVEVQDSGIGIAPQEQARLFQEFSQANVKVASEFGGTGLGLALCRKLVGAMGGTIDVESTPGMGSRFWFELPCPAPGDGAA